MTSRQPPNDSVASHRFRLFRPKESFVLRCASNSSTPLLNGLTIERLTALRYVVTNAAGAAPSLIFVFQVFSNNDVELTHVEVFEAD